MSKPIIATARELAREVRAQEETLDAAVAGQARLIGALLDARRSAGVSARTGTAALDRAFDAIGHARQLRDSMIAMHNELAQMNLRELATGDTDDCPKEPSGYAGLAVVASKQAAA